MLSAILIAMLAASQVVFAPQPVAAPAAAPGTERFERDLASQRERLEAKCVSPEGINIIQQAFTVNRAQATASPQEWQMHEEAVAQAVYAEPFDSGKFRLAVEARARFRAQREIESVEASLATFANLSEKDRVIFARGMTSKQPLRQTKVCQPR